MSQDEVIGKAAYKGYCQYSGNRSLISGSVLPSWEDLNPEIKKAWIAAAIAVDQLRAVL